jgi:hypothetical protein
MNPYAAPQTLSHECAFRRALTWHGAAALCAIGSLGGAVLGILTNAVNGAVSPHFFRDVMQWEDVESIWWAAVGQGAFEGAVRGLAYGLLFVVLICFACGRQAEFRVLIRYALAALCMALMFWVLGGAIAIAIAYVLPDWCSPRFFGPFVEWSLRARYAWVRGSIWGITYGGGLAVVLTYLVYAIREREQTMQPG